MALRPYFVTFRGVARLVEASSPAVAAQHVVGPEIEELRPARAAEVAGWYKAGRPVDVAGKDLTDGFTLQQPSLAQQAVPAPGLGGLEAVFETADARIWLGDKIAAHARKFGMVECIQGEAVVAFDQAARTGILTLEGFNAISAACPAFEEIVDRSELTDDETIDFQDVVTAIAKAKRAELYDDKHQNPAAPAEPA